MKKTIITMFASILMSALGVTTLFAQASLNSPGSMPTLTIANVSTNPCNMGPIDGCWKQSVSAAPGQQVAVHVYYKNTGTQNSEGTTLSIKPQSAGPASSVTFTGGVASLSAPRSVGSASVSFSTTSKVSYIPGSARWYPSSSSGGQSVNESGLFGSTGFNIGTISPGTQGVLVANFIVEAAGGNGGDNNPQPQNCSINSFTVNGQSSITIDRGQTATLNWSTNCDFVTVTNFSGNMAPTGSGSISPQQTTTYTLTAYPNGGTRSVTVNVRTPNNPQPQNCSINSFTVNGQSSITIDRGQTATLNWSTNCDFVTVTNFSGNMAPTGSGSISPQNDYTYTLTAYPNGGTRTVHVNVRTPQQPVQDCRINDFTVDGRTGITIEEGDSVRLVWSTSDCEYVTVTGLSGNLSANSSQTVYPSSSRTYTVRAYPNGGTRDVQVTVRQKQTPNPTDNCRIDDFTVDGRTSITINKGDSARLRWYTTDCEYVTVTNFSGNMSPNGSGSISPTSSRTYTLKAYPGGKTATVRVNVTNNNTNDRCYVNEFRANRTTIERGQTATLTWNVDGADTVDITPGYRNRSASGSVSVSPSSTTTYTLNASGNNCSNSAKLTIYVNERDDVKPQAITTIAAITGPNSAQLNGIAVPNTVTLSSSTWFEWGPSRSLGYQTGSRHIAAGSGSTTHGDSISGLVAGTTYYYRIVVQNANGTAYGDIVSFRTQAKVVGTTTVVTQPTKVIVQTIRDSVTTQSTPSLLELQVASAYDHMCIGGEMEYVVTYRNISSVTLEDAVVRIALPKELTYVGANRGSYDSLDRILTVPVGRVAPGEQGSITVRAQFNENSIRGNLAVMTATVVYTNPTTRAQEDAIAYSLVTVSDECPLVLGASVYGFGSFLPDTLLEWLLLILVILALIILGRNLYKKREEEKKLQ